MAIRRQKQKASTPKEALYEPRGMGDRRKKNKGGDYVLIDKDAMERFKSEAIKEAIQNAMERFESDAIKEAIQNATEAANREAIRNFTEVAKETATEAATAANREAIRNFTEVAKETFKRYANSSLISQSAVEVGAEVLETAVVSDEFLPPPVDEIMNNRVWPCQKWPSQDRRILQEQFIKMLRDDVRWDQTAQKLSFTGNQQQGASADKQADFTIHMKDKEPHPCYVVAVLSLYSFSEPVKTKKERKYNSKSHVGLTINRACKVLRDSGPSRQKIIAGVTNLRSVQWFLVEREVADAPDSKSFIFTKSTERNEVRESLSSFLLAEPATLFVASCINIKINNAGLECISFLGSGASSCVHACKWSGHDVSAKFHTRNFDAENEIKFLRLLGEKGVQGVPTIMGVSADKKVLLTCPIGVKLHKRIPERMKEKLADVLGILEKAHENNIVHRDVRLANMLLDKDSFLLIDWGFACFAGEPQTFAGYLLASSSSVLDQYCNGNRVCFSSSDDLVSFVKSLYLLNHRDFEIELKTMDIDPFEQNSRVTAVKVKELWQSKLASCRHWLRAIELAEQSSYQELKTWVIDWALNYCP